MLLFYQLSTVTKYCVWSPPLHWDFDLESSIVKLLSSWLYGILIWECCLSDLYMDPFSFRRVASVEQEESTSLIILIMYEEWKTELREWINLLEAQ